MNFKHSKYFNTAIVFDSLTQRSLQEEIHDLDKFSEQLIYTHFNNDSELLKDLYVYEQIKEYGECESSINRMVEYNLLSIDKKRLKEEKIELIKNIKNNTSIDKLLSSNIKDYKKYASIYILLENWDNLKNEDQSTVTSLYNSILDK